MTRRPRPRRAHVAGALAVVGLTGLLVSSAASLNLGGHDLGAGSAVVASCQPTSTAIDVRFTNDYDATLKGYAVTAVELRNVASACTGQKVSIALTSSSGARLGQVSGTVSAATQSFTLTAPVAADQVVGTAVVIAG